MIIKFVERKKKWYKSMGDGLVMLVLVALTYFKPVFIILIVLFILDELYDLEIKK